MPKGANTFLNQEQVRNTLLKLWYALDKKRDPTLLVAALAEWVRNWEAESALSAIEVPAYIDHLPSTASSPVPQSESSYDSVDLAVPFTQGPTVSTPSLDKLEISANNHWQYGTTRGVQNFNPNVQVSPWRLAQAFYTK